MTRIQKLAVGGVAVLAISGAGAAVAATKLRSPKEERQAIVNDVAGQLGVTPQQLTSAFKTAIKNRIDQAVKDGHLTQAEANRLKARIDRADVPFLGPGFGFRGHHGPRGGPFAHHLDAAATYLGLSDSALRTQLESGKTLAQVAKDRNKPVDGLVDAMLADKRKRIEQAVEDGRLTRADADDLLAGLKTRTTDLVNGRFPTEPPRFFRHFRGDRDEPGAFFAQPA